MRFRLPLVVVLSLVFAAPAVAQYGGAGGGMRRGGTGASGSDSRARPTEPSSSLEVTRLSANDQIRLQLTDVRLALKLPAEQAAVWQNYEDKVLALLNDLSRGADVSSDGSAPNQIERKIDVVRNRLTAMEDLSDSAKKLYAVLSDEQKTLADRLLPGTVPALYSGSGTSGARTARPGERLR